MDETPTFAVRDEGGSSGSGRSGCVRVQYRAVAVAFPLVNSPGHSEEPTKEPSVYR
jgi:hypothetical protein